MIDASHAHGFRHLGRALKRAPERLLHPVRRRSSARRLRALGPPASVLVVCRGNICRSPFGEHYLHALLRKDGIPAEVASAGFLKAGRRPPSDACRAAAEHGLDLSAHRSRPVTAAAVRDADVVLVMEPVHARLLGAEFPEVEPRIFLLGDFDPDPVIELRSIRDPINRGVAEFRSGYRRMARCLRCVIGPSVVGARPGRASVRGPETFPGAAGAAATRASQGAV